MKILAVKLRSLVDLLHRHFQAETLQACGDVDSIAIQAFTFDDHITQVDANAKVHLAVVE